MQKWDFLYLVLDAENKYDLERLRYVIRYVNGKELPNWKQGPNVHMRIYCRGKVGNRFLTVLGIHRKSHLHGDL